MLQTDDHRRNIIDEKLGIARRNRTKVLIWGTEALTDLVNSGLPCIKSLFCVWWQFKTCFHTKVTTTHNNLLHSPLFYNPWILTNLQVADFLTYHTNKKKACLEPQDYGLGTLGTSSDTVRYQTSWIKMM